MRNKESELSAILIELIDELVRKRLAEILNEKKVEPIPDRPLKSLSSTMANKYPPEFDKFWMQFPPERRKEKARALSAWKKLSGDVKLSVIFAAKNYCDANVLENGGKYIKYPERFISHRTYEDWGAADKDTTWMIKAMDYFSDEHLKKTGMIHNFSDKLREMAIADFKQLGPDLCKDKFYAFFSDKDFKIRDECKEKGYGYFTFHLLLTTLLKDSKLKRPLPCPICKKLDGHEEDCPTLVKIREDKEKELVEVEEGRLVHVDMSELFKKKLKEKKDVENTQES